MIDCATINQQSTTPIDEDRSRSELPAYSYLGKNTYGISLGAPVAHHSGNGPSNTLVGSVIYSLLEVGVEPGVGQRSREAAALPHQTARGRATAPRALRFELHAAACDTTRVFQRSTTAMGQWRRRRCRSARTRPCRCPSTRRGHYCKYCAINCRYAPHGYSYGVGGDFSRPRDPTPPSLRSSPARAPVS